MDPRDGRRVLSGLIDLVFCTPRPGLTSQRLLDGILSCVVKRLASGRCPSCSAVSDYQYLAYY